MVFGNKYYIGQSYHIAKRAGTHMSEINSIIMYRDGTNSDGNIGKKANIIEHLLANRKIRKIDVFILEECKECDLQNREQEWLLKSKGDLKCLNKNFVSFDTPTQRDNKKIEGTKVSVELELNTRREKNLYEKFLKELEILKEKPHAKIGGYWK